MSSQTRPDFSDPSHSLRSLRQRKIKKTCRLCSAAGNCVRVAKWGEVEDKCHGVLSTDGLNACYRPVFVGGNYDEQVYYSQETKKTVMKKVMFGFCLLLGSAVATYAQDSTSTASNQYASTPQQDKDKQQKDEYSDKEVIATSDLPQRVREQIQGQDYSGWTVSKAYRKTKDGKTLYAVELVQGSDKKMVKFDADGNKLKEKNK